MLATTQANKSTPLSHLITFNKDGAIKDNNTLPKGFSAEDMIVLDNQTYLIAGTMSSKATPPYAVVMHMNAKGNKTFQRAYRPGADTTLLDLTRMNNGMIMASGHISDTQNNQAAWVMMINEKGEIQWQQRYARGRAARVLDTYMLDNTHIMIAGQIVSDNDTIGSAAWVAMIDAQNGTMHWERFYTTDSHHNAAQAILPTNRGRSVSVLMRAKPSYPVIGVSDYLTRVLTLNWRGVLLNLQDYASGKGARVNAIISAPNDNRALIGMVQREYTSVSLAPETESDENTTSSIAQVPTPVDMQSGWILRIPAVDIYQDPCLPQNNMTQPVQPPTTTQKSYFP